MPGKIRDERVLEYQLLPQMIVPPDQLRNRAERLRRGVQASSLGPAAPPAPGVRNQYAPQCLSRRGPRREPKSCRLRRPLADSRSIRCRRGEGRKGCEGYEGCEGWEERER